MVESPRRRFLKWCAVASLPLAGCSSDDNPPASPQGTGTPTVSSRATGTPASTPGRTGTTANPESPTEHEPSTDTESSPATPDSDPTAAEAWRVEQLDGTVDELLLPDVGPADAPAGPLYAATEAGDVARIDAASGELAWAMTTHGDTEGEPALSPRPDTVYAVSETYREDRLANHLEAIDSGSGRVQWRFDDRVFLRVLGVVDDRVVLAGEDIDEHPEKIGPMRSPRGDGHLFGLDRETGEVRWTVDVPDLRGATVASHGVYATEWQETEDPQLLDLHAMNLDGTERWTVETGTQNPGEPVAADELLLAGAGASPASREGGIGRYNPTDGSLEWTAGQWERGPDGIVIEDDTIYAGGHPLLALTRDGSERYRVNWHSIPEFPGTPETLYSAGGSQIRALDRASGTDRWQYTPEAYEYTHIRAVLADYLAVDRGIGPDRGVVLLDEMDGSIAGRFETPAAYSAAVGSGRRLFLGVGSAILAFDIAPTEQ